MQFQNLWRWRLASGSIMFVYIALHMANHALAVWSIPLAEDALRLAMALWQNLPATLLLYGAAAVHFSLALVTIFERRHWRLPPVEWLRLWAGFSLPWLLIGHVFATRVSSGLYGAETSYRTIVGSLVRGGLEGWQIALLAPGWIHGCLGLWLTLRRFEFARRAQPFLLALMIGLPIVSAAGFGVMARAAHVVGAAPVAAATTAEQRATMERWRQSSVALYILLLLSAAGAGAARNTRDKKRQTR